MPPSQSSPSPTASLLLDVRGVHKHYGRIEVLRGVDLQVGPGQIHALLGANGAGKSTLCKIIAGLTPATSGQMQLSGQDFWPAGKQAAEHAGIQIVHQELNLIPTLNVAENVSMGRLPNRWGVLRRGLLHQRARTALDRFGLTEIDTRASVAKLGVGQQQMVEIATVLDRQCQLLILDEPTAALSGAETETLFGQLAELRDRGVGIIYISHRLDEVVRIADAVTIMRDGRVVDSRASNSLHPDEMVAIMSGEEACGDQQPFVSHVRDEVALRVDGLAGAGFIHDISFTLHRGERLGVTGLVGSGRTELLRLIFGADRGVAGSMRLGERGESGRPGKLFSHPSQAVAAEMAMVTEDRKQNGLLLSMDIVANTSISSMTRQFSNLGILRRRGERQAATEMVDRLATRCQNVDQSVGTLSGGNQQKVAVSKWLVRDADVFLFDEPTRGIDVAARRRIHDLFASLAQQGKSMIIVSSDLEELLETCDRILVMSAGRLVGQHKRGSWSVQQITLDSFSGYQNND